MTKLQGFYDFINKQPDNKSIDNRFAWQNCAVGEYLQEKLKLSRKEYFTQYQSLDDEFLKDLLDENPSLYHLLNESRFNNYGELKLYLTHS